MEAEVRRIHLFTLQSAAEGMFVRARELTLLSRCTFISWDEWVPEDRLKKYNEENIRKQKALIEAQRARDAAEREAAKANDAAEAAAMRKLAGQGGAAGGAGGAGRGTAKGGQKRGRDGDAVSPRR